MGEYRKCLICKTEFKTYKSTNKRYCSLSCRNKSYIGRKQTESQKNNISKALKDKCIKGYRPKNLFQKGKKHLFWIIDRSLVKLIETKEYNELRIKVFKRDDYTCQNCRRRGMAGDRPILEMHHIKERKNYPELALEESNCITLCRECHKKTDSYLNRWVKKIK